MDAIHKRALLSALGASLCFGSKNVNANTKAKAGIKSMASTAQKVDKPQPAISSSSLQLRLVNASERGTSLRDLSERLEKLLQLDPKGRFESAGEYKSRVSTMAEELGVTTNPAKPYSLGLAFKCFENSYDADTEVCRLGHIYSVNGNAFSLDALQAEPNPWGVQEILAEQIELKSRSRFFTELIEQHEADGIERLNLRPTTANRTRGRGVGLIVDENRRAKAGLEKFKITRDVAKEHFDHIAAIIQGQPSYPFIVKGRVFLFAKTGDEYQVNIAYKVICFIPQILTIFSQLDGRVFHQILFDQT